MDDPTVAEAILNLEGPLREAGMSFYFAEGLRIDADMEEMHPANFLQAVSEHATHQLPERLMVAISLKSLGTAYHMDEAAPPIRIGVHTVHDFYGKSVTDTYPVDSEDANNVMSNLFGRTHGIEEGDIPVLISTFIESHNSSL